MKIKTEIIWEVGDRVKLPLKETGTIVRINNKSLDWFKYKVRIRKATLNKTNQILEYKYDELEIDNIKLED